MTIRRSFWKGFALTFGLLAGVGVALAATFNLFQPAAGILKGNPSTYVTTAAASSDVVSLWTGTCNSTTFLRADGSCQAAGGGGGGSVTSVGLTVPTGLSVTGSPITTSGTLAITTALNGPVRGNGTGLITGNTSLTTEVSGTLPVANGGTGAVTLSGVLKGNGTSAVGSAVASDVYGLWAGGCSSANFLRGDGTCAAPAGAGTVTSITAGTGLSASPGSPITTSGTLSLNQGVNATWTGSQLFQGSGVTQFANTSGEQIRIVNDAGYISFYNTANNTRTGYIQGQSANSMIIGTEIAQSLIFQTSSASRLTITAGGTVQLPTSTTIGGNTPLTNISTLAAANLSGTVAIPVSTTTGAFSSSLTVGGNNVCQSTGTNCPAGGTSVTGTYSASYNGCSSGSTTVSYTITGNQVTVRFPAFSCVSNSSSFSIDGTNSPAGMRPGAGNARYIGTTNGCQDNSTAVTTGVCAAFVDTNGNISFLKNNGLWTASGTKGPNYSSSAAPQSFSYATN